MCIPSCSKCVVYFCEKQSTLAGRASSSTYLRSFRSERCVGNITIGYLLKEDDSICILFHGWYRLWPPFLLLSNQCTESRVHFTSSHLTGGFVTSNFPVFPACTCVTSNSSKGERGDTFAVDFRGQTRCVSSSLNVFECGIGAFNRNKFLSIYWWENYL